MQASHGPYRIGIDLGGTKIEAAVLAPDGCVVIRRREATPRGDYDATLALMTRLVHELELEVGQRCSVGVAIPGTISAATGRVKNANSTWVIDKPLDRDLERCLERRVRIANDANCFALSEATDGAAADAKVVFGVILGTGVGGGCVVHGELLQGINAVAGEWGHNPLPWPRDDERPGDRCYCGQNGCIETFLSGPGLARRHFRQTGEELDAATIVARAAAGEDTAEASLDLYEDQLARSLATLINVVDPEVIVLGGGMSNVKRLYDQVPRLWQQWVFSDRVDTRLVPPSHGDSSGVRGAAWLWPEESS
jgi:predicted NBD/HSP70 family sugar kinase